MSETRLQIYLDGMKDARLNVAAGTEQLRLCKVHTEDMMTVVVGADDSKGTQRSQ